ncbi:M23 family metallopeptidase [soil metagenome]|jgi:murein DD-endopeptidase MepM/ murein hydrolase activator NlpD
MRNSRFLLPFTLGAISMLVLVIAAGWAAPRVLGRVPAALGFGVSLPGGAAEISAAPIASAVPLVGVAPADLPATQTPSPAAPVAALRLLIPVKGVKATSLVDTYEQARGQGRRHDAIDIMAPRGTPVLASSDGVVMKLFQSDRGGTTLYQLAPDKRTIYYYAHLDRYASGMAEGRGLRRGEVLGYVGNTGDSGPGNYHLHFEVSTTLDPSQYWGGVPQNPYPLLR